MPRANRRTNTNTAALRFDERLVLNQYLLALFEVKSFDDLAKDFKDEKLEGWDENNISYFYHQLTNSRLFGFTYLSNEALLQYDQNIFRHTQAIQGKRPEKIKWKYFQYLTLLFAEIYLDRLFRDRNGLLADLNQHVDMFNQEKNDGDKIAQYDGDDLNKLAFWNATGSGKTLIMHVNILQYQHYLNLHGRTKELNRIILLTPNEGLSRQHLEECSLSGLPARLFDKEASLYGSSVSQAGLWDSGSYVYQALLIGDQRKHIIEIIDIHKLKDDSGVKTIAIDSFEGNNLVLVDEGHRGSSGIDWKSRRDKLCENGFSFEYSATFGQAMKAANKPKLTQEYAKCIIFDYSYKRFFKDGYGKMYNILNLAEERHEEQRNLYITACLLTFFQQLCIYMENRAEMVPFYLEKPLWIFVGSKVTAVRTDRGRKVSDVVDILLFLNDFLENQDKTINKLNLLLNGKSGLRDSAGAEIFADSFTYLIKHYADGEQLLRDILKLLFNNASPGARLHVDDLKGADGELGLRVGDGDYFGVINVGDDRALLKLCEENNLNISEREFASSLFSNINSRDSKINMLIGSKKFSEGWNSWRVSTMGLMNVGRNEGSEIIQLFGRGVRLKGYNMSLKRSNAMHITEMKTPEHLPDLETLNVFGVRADYMKQFKEYLEEEGLPSNNKPIKYELKIIPTIPATKLKVIKVKDGVDFKKSAKRPTLSLPSEYEYKNPVVVNWYPKIQVIESQKHTPANQYSLESNSFDEKHIAFMNMDRIYFELQNYKNERNWYNLNLNRKILTQLLLDRDWYILYIPSHEMIFDNFSKVMMWQEIAVTLLKKYCERFYNGKKAAFEDDKIEYVYVQDYEKKKVKEGKSGNIPSEYTFSVDPSATSFIAHLEKLISAVNEDGFKGYPEFNGCDPIIIDNHLYKPLIFLNNSQVKISPVPLNEGERRFIKDFKQNYDENLDKFIGKEVYLLRNQSKGRGISFFEAGNFYPDFILWLIEGNKQFISFIDPKGLRYVDGWEDPKIRFYQTIKERQKSLESKSEEVILNSFIISVTPYNDLNWRGDHSKNEFEEHHVLFQEDGIQYIEKMFDIIG